MGNDLPGCAVDLRILQLILLALDRFGSAGVSDIQRPCIGVSINCPSSPHCASPGGAIDFYRIGGVGLTGGNARTIELLQFLDPLVPHGTLAGQVGCRSISLSNLAQFADSCDHQHIDFRNTSEPLNVASPPVAFLGYKSAFQANVGQLYTHSSTRGPANLVQGMKASTSPSIAALPRGGYQSPSKPTPEISSF